MLAPVATAQEPIDQENLSNGRQFGIGGEAFLPTLTVAYLSGRFWTSENVGFDGGAGAISIPGAATFPSFLGRLLFKFADNPSTDFYLTLGASAVLFGGSPVMMTQGQTTNVLIGAGIEHSTSRTMAFPGEVDLVIGGGGFNIVAGGALHFYLDTRQWNKT